MPLLSIFYYRFPGATRRLATRNDAPELDPDIAGFYAAYRCPAPAPGEDAPTELIAVRRANDGTYAVAAPGGDWEAETPDVAVLYYEYELTDALLEDAGAFVRLHGAAVCHGSRCLLLVGPSGAGKSTLALGLRLRGRQVLADDALLIDRASEEVQPFGRSIRVHEASLERLGVVPGEVEGGHVCGPYLWVGPEERGGARSPRRPDTFVFLEAGRRTALERLRAAETLKLLLVARLGDAPQSDFECLARLAARVPGYRLSFVDFPAALEALERL